MTRHVTVELTEAQAAVLDSEAARELAEHALELSSAAEVRKLVADEAAVPSRSPAS